MMFLEPTGLGISTSGQRNRTHGNDDKQIIKKKKKKKRKKKKKKHQQVWSAVPYLEGVFGIKQCENVKLLAVKGLRINQLLFRSR